MLQESKAVAAVGENDGFVSSEDPGHRSHAERPALFWPLWVAAVLVPVLLFSGTTWWSWNVVRGETHARMERTVNMLHEHALRAFETQEALLAAVQLRTAGMSWPEIAADAGVAAFLRGLDESILGMGSLGMFNPAGRLAQFSGGPFPTPLVDSSDRDFVRAQRGPSPGPFIGEVAMGRMSEREVFTLSRPRLDGAGRPDGGALTVTFRPDDFRAFYGSVAETPGDATLLLRRDGALLARHPPPATALVERLAPTDALMRAVAAAAPGVVAFAEGASPFDGQPLLFAARSFERYPLAIVHGLHRDGPRFAWLRQVYSMAASAGAAMLLLLGLTWLAGSRAKRATAALSRERDALAHARREADGRAEAEAALRRGQRLAVLGQIVAGVAHDFRNVVQAVQAGAVLMGKALDRGNVPRARSLAAMVAEAAGRGIELTQRMLRGIGGRGPEAGADAAVLEPGKVLADTAGLLSRTIGARYTLRLTMDEAAAAPSLVRGDPIELEAALLNLALNARDAMPEGGEIVITAAAEEIAGPEHQAGLAPGRYVRIGVVDSGIGMDADTLVRASKPFFTTKAAGNGTGLGLATARAFARGAGGRLTIESGGPGRGTTATLWLPEDLPETGSPA